MSKPSPLAPQALLLWRQGWNRKEIATELGISEGWTYDLIQNAKHRDGSSRFDDLSPRAESFLFSAFPPLEGDVYAIKSWLSSQIKNRVITDRSHRNVGKKTFEELCEWCGLGDNE